MSVSWRGKVRTGRGAASPVKAAPLVALLAALAVSPAAGQTAYTNPVVGGEVSAADPFVLKWNGEYYLYVSGDPIVAYHSRDLVEWEEIGPVLASSDGPGAWNQTDVWAPEVVYRNGVFYLSYTATRSSPDWRVEEMARRIGVATAASPRGPFVDVGRPLTPGWGIDSHVFRDPRDGRDYLFYSYLYEPRLPGAGIVVDSMSEPTRVGGAPSHVTRGSEPWEDKDGDPNNGSLRYTNEAPTVLERNGRYYMFYSGGSWDLPTYALGYAVADRLMDGGLEGPGWTKVEPPILRSTPLVEAPGHNSLVMAPNNVDLITAYHARPVPFAGPGERQTFLDRLFWNHDRPFLRPPATGPLTAPDHPRVRDLFDRSGRLGSAWREVAGDWRVVDGEARQAGRSGALALIVDDPREHYVFEANVRSTEGGGGVAGVAAYFRDASNRVDAWLDPSRHALVTSGVLGGRPIEEVATALEPAFRFDAYHQILVTKNADRLGITVDGVRLQDRRLPLGEGVPGLATRGAAARFDGVALTAHFEETFSGPAATFTAEGGAWMVDEGALHQAAGGPGRAFALRGDPATDYELTASVRWRDGESVRSTVGVVAAAAADGSMVLGGFDHTIWPFARFHVRHMVDGEVRSEASVGMPRGFLYDVFHTIRVVRQGEDFTFFLDGVEIAAARFPLRGLARPGLFTEAARAAFDDVSMTHLGVPHNLVLDGGFEAERWEEGEGSPTPPWLLSGGAERSLCCAHGGSYRLLLSESDARATQRIPTLAPGRHTLLAFVTTREGDGTVEVAVDGLGTERGQRSGGEWGMVRIDFEVPEGSPGVTLSLGARIQGPGGFVAVDDVYLYRR